MAWEGEDLKFKIELNANGFDMSQNEFRLVLKRGSKELDVAPTEIVSETVTEQGETRTDYYLCLKAPRLEQLGVGEVFLIGYADVPDLHFSDGIRTQIDKQKLCTITRL